jgi:hypothetical protein
VESEYNLAESIYSGMPGQSSIKKGPADLVQNRFLSGCSVPYYSGYPASTYKQCFFPTYSYFTFAMFS